MFLYNLVGNFQRAILCSFDETSLFHLASSKIMIHLIYTSVTNFQDRVYYALIRKNIDHI